MLTQNEMLTTTRIKLGGSGHKSRNPNIRGTPEWHTWNAGYAAARADTGLLIALRDR